MLTNINGVEFQHYFDSNIILKEYFKGFKEFCKVNIGLDIDIIPFSTNDNLSRADGGIPYLKKDSQILILYYFINDFSFNNISHNNRNFDEYIIQEVVTFNIGFVCSYYKTEENIKKNLTLRVLERVTALYELYKKILTENNLRESKVNISSDYKSNTWENIAPAFTTTEPALELSKKEILIWNKNMKLEDFKINKTIVNIKEA